MGAQYGHLKSVQNWNRKTGEYTGTLDQLMSDVEIGMDAATLQLAIEQGMSKALESAKVRGVMDANNDSRYVNTKEHFLRTIQRKKIGFGGGGFHTKSL